jgi:hypothetical protein
MALPRRLASPLVQAKSDDSQWDRVSRRKNPGRDPKQMAAGPDNYQYVRVKKT